MKKVQNHKGWIYKTRFSITETQENALKNPQTRANPNYKSQDLKKNKKKSSYYRLSWCSWNYGKNLAICIIVTGSRLTGNLQPDSWHRNPCLDFTGKKINLPSDWYFYGPYRPKGLFSIILSPVKIEFLFFYSIYTC